MLKGFETYEQLMLDCMQRGVRYLNIQVQTFALNQFHLSSVSFVACFCNVCIIYNAVSMLENV